MIVTAVESTTLRTIAYDARLAVLRLEFCSRAVYDYFDVPPAIHQSLLSAASAGTCFNATVRGCFPFRRVSGVDAECVAKGGR